MHCPAGAAARCPVPPLRPKPPILVQCAGMFLNIFKLRVKSLKRLGRFYPSYFEHFSNFARANSYRLNTPANEISLNIPACAHHTPTLPKTFSVLAHCWRTAGAPAAGEGGPVWPRCPTRAACAAAWRPAGAVGGSTAGHGARCTTPVHADAARGVAAACWLHAGCTLAARWRDRDAVYVLSPR